MRMGAVVPSGRWAVVYDEQALRLYNAEGRPRSAVSLEGVEQIAMDERWIAVVTQKRRLSVWKLPTLSPTPMWSIGLSDLPVGLSVAHNRVAVGFSSGAIGVYSASEGRRIAWRGLTEPISALAWDTQPDWLWAGTDEGWLWRTTANASERWVRLSIGELIQLCVNHKFLYAATGDGGVHQVETRARQVAYRWYGSPVEVSALARWSDGVVSADRTGIVWRWRPGKAVPVDEFPTPLGTIWGISDHDTALTCLAIGVNGIARLHWQGKRTHWLHQFTPKASPSINQEEGG